MQMRAAVLALALIAPVEADHGLVAQRPAGGRFVQTSGGYMVSYIETIPGSTVTFEMVPIPGGTFLMGSPDAEPGRNPDEGPQFEVVVEPFWMGRHEVTWAEYHQFMALYEPFKKFESLGLRVVREDNVADAVTIPTRLYDPSVTYGRGQDPRHPAATMTPYAARQYTKWLSGITGRFYRLPTEAEWEYAARAGSTHAYSFGAAPEALDEYGWYMDNSYDEDAGIEMYGRVGTRKPNAWGLHDMHGNVGELVIDEYRRDHYGQFAGTIVSWREIVAWPMRRDPRVYRGGWCQSTAAECRSAARGQTDDAEWKITDPCLPRSPWWYASDPPIPIGMRIIRPFDPEPRESRQRFWEEQAPEVLADVQMRVRHTAGGIRGLVDASLPDALQELNNRPE